MKIKWLAIISIIVAFVMIGASVLLFVLKEDNGLKVDEPAYINVYLHSVKEKKATKDSEVYTKVIKLYKEMTQSSYFDIFIVGQKLGRTLTQDEDAEIQSWTEFNKVNYNCVEMIFENPQKQILMINGSTKRVDFYSIIFVVEDLTGLNEIAIYYSVENDQNYLNSGKSRPFVVRANLEKMYKYMTDLSKE